MAYVCALVVTGAPLTARAADIAQALATAGWQVNVAATPSSAAWLDSAAIATVTGAPPRIEARDPSLPKTARPAAVVVAPATFNTLNKLAAGIADTYAHGLVCEAVGAGARVLVVPMVNNLLWGHPAVARSLELLAAAGVRLADIHTGRDRPSAVSSGTGPEVVATFDPAWVVAGIGEPAKRS